jgi:RNA polymerase sigma factor (sigma-70 family)
LKEFHLDQKLIEGCLRRFPEAQEAVYKQVYVHFMKICLRYTGNYDDAANVMQDAFIKIFTRIDSFHGKGSFEAWMKRILVNQAVDFVRKQKQFQQVEFKEKYDIIENQEEEESILMDEAHILEIIGELPKMQLLVFNLFVMDQCSHQEIAERLSISVATSKWYLFEARRILKTKLKKIIYGQE